MPDQTTDFDDAYANGAYIEDAASYPPRWAQASTALCAELGERARRNTPYGPSGRMVIDHFAPEDMALGTLVFVHGGYWRAFDPSTWSFLAKGALARGWAVAMPGYDLCPDVRIAGITAQIAQAIQMIADQTDGPLALTGHSAGGHLVARMCAPGMLPADVLARVQSVVPISPLSDLEPLTHTAMNDDFRMDAGMARAESPVHQPAPDVPVTVWVGGAERPAFVDQARWLSSAWGCGLYIAKDKHHFDVIDPLTDPGSTLLNTLLAP